MKSTNENETRRHTDPSNVNRNAPDSPRKKSAQEEVDQSTTYVDLDKTNFAERKHGRTTESLGPDHEPGTV